MFNGKTFQKTQIVGPDGKLNKTCYKDQAAEDIGSNCNKSNPCLVHTYGTRGYFVGRTL